MKRHKRSDRNGVILVCVLSCLVVSSVLVALTVQSSLRGRHEARIQMQLRQTELLCEAGVMRAAAQMASSPDYKGERWEPQLNLENYRDAIVEIDITAAEQDTPDTDKPAKKVTVIAKLDSYLDQDGPMQRTYNFYVPMKTAFTSSEKR